MCFEGIICVCNYMFPFLYRLHHKPLLVRVVLRTPLILLVVVRVPGTTNTKYSSIHTGTSS